MKEFFIHWIQAAGIRAVKTFAQTMAGMLTGDAIGMMDVEWMAILSVSALAAIASLATSVAGLPELKDWKPPEE